ncbi:hypothetical protein [Saccharospirillum mangrovi]|uniref:hypothetical protein n=1 Tax=Saccharospirillum mangrovi TaxID=2161747 RepID=UPI0013003A02|nr:hypothetical protein [Saccharospirillum mangrovi]
MTKAEIDSAKINYNKANLTANALQSLPNEHHTLLKVTEERIIQFSLKEIHRIILHYLINFSIGKNDQKRQLKNADSIILSQCTAAKRLDLICQHISNENGIVLEKVCTIAFFCIFFKFSEFRNINGIHSWITAISFSIDQELSKLAYPKGVSVYETLKNTPKYTLEETDKSLLRIISNYFLGLPLRF